ncbi:MAG: trypsin-like peptidase domain-containing protein [Gemmatimonadetes bacterium]|nr:trypsin-like peptidase domain-containing protein [Gemmatimonadota bacterium]
MDASDRDGTTGTHTEGKEERRLPRGIAAAVAGLALASGIWWAGASAADTIEGATPQLQDRSEVAGLDAAAVAPARDLSDAFVNIAAATTPAVVRLEVEVPVTAGRQEQMREIPEPFRRFFEMPPGGGGGAPDMPDFRLGGGSGFIVSPDGLILTNAHVVGAASQITVHLQDRRRFQAELVGSDPTTDVALVRIDASGLPTLPLGNSDDVRVGDWVVAVGNPGLGGAGSQLDYTVTAGIISAIGRPLGLIGQELPEEIAPYAIENFLQTDAVINPGNSGGPMVDLNGRVVGINSAIASRSGYYQGYGFALPINLAHRVMEDLLEFGVVRRPLLGVRIESITPEDAAYYRLPSIAGILVQGVEPGGPAEEAGLEPGDVIVAVDGVQVATAGDLQQRIAQSRPGAEVDITYYRDGEPETTEIELGQASLERSAAVAEAPAAPEAVGSSLGMRVEDLDAATARRMGFESAPDGPVIVEVQPLGPAARRGIRPGMVIARVNERPVETAEDVRRALEAMEPGGIASLLVRFPDGTTRIVNVRMPR